MDCLARKSRSSRQRAFFGRCCPGLDVFLPVFSAGSPFQELCRLVSTKLAFAKGRDSKDSAACTALGWLPPLQLKSHRCPPISPLRNNSFLLSCWGNGFLVELALLEFKRICQSVRRTWDWRKASLTPPHPFLFQRRLFSCMIHLPTLTQPCQGSAKCTLSLN